MNEEDAFVEILTQAADLFKEKGIKPDLAKLERKTGLSRQRLRRWQKNGYVWITEET